MPDLFSPLEVRGLALRNRIMMPPMASDVATEAGEVTPRHLEHYLARARAQVALLVVEHTYVRRSGRLTRTQLGLHDDALVAGFRRLVEAIRPTGARLVLQLTHAGSATTAAVAEAVPEGPSAVLHPSGREVPRELTVADLAQTCGLLHDLVESEQVRHVGQHPLSAAAEAVGIRSLTRGGWLWKQVSETSIEPINAVTLALWGIEAEDEPFVV